MTTRGQQRREFSKAVFGNSYRLELLAAIAARDRPFYARELAVDLDVADNLVTTQLAKLWQAGLLERQLARRAVLYVRKPSRVWDLVTELADDWESVPARPSTRSTFRMGDVEEPLATALSVARAGCPEVDAGTFARLARSATDLVASGRCREGLSVGELARRAGVSRGSIAALDGADWRIFSVVAIRALLALSELRTGPLEIASTLVPVRRSTNVLGADRVPGGPTSLRLMTMGYTAPDRHVPLAAIPLTSGTRDDATSPRVDADRIAGWERMLGMAPPATIAEHVAQLLSDLGRARRALEQAMEFEGMPRATFVELLRSEKPPELVMPRIPIGPVDRRTREIFSVAFPGNDEAVVKAVRRAGWRGVLASGSLEGHLPDALDDSFRRLPRIDEWLGVGMGHAVYYWSDERRQLARSLASTPSYAALWRVVGYDEVDPHPAAAAIEHHELSATIRAAGMRQWVNECAPGLVTARGERTRVACIALANLAYAAIVTADRSGPAASSDLVLSP